jgi:predicted transcriptional regulator
MRIVNGKKEVRQSFTIQLYSGLKDAVVKQAATEGRSQSRLIAQALSEYLAQRTSVKIEIE